MNGQRRISRREFIKFSGTSLVGGMCYAEFGFHPFAAAAETDFGTIRFGVISDAHLDIHGINGMKMSAESVASMEKTVQGLNMEKDLCFVLVTGDLLLDGERENAEKIKTLLDGLICPYFIVAGNHDYLPADPKNRREGCSYLTINEFVQLFKGHGYVTERYYALGIKPGLRLIGLDGCLPDDPQKWGGIIPEVQLTWLENQLNDHASDLNLIMIHHNLVQWTEDENKGGSKEWFTIENAEEVRSVLAQHARSAPVVISGHRHIGLNYKQIAGVNYFTVPSINSHPMRYVIFELSHQVIAWKTPMVNLPASIHTQARENLLNATWWRDTQYRDRNAFSDTQVLALYENPNMVSGRKKLF